MIRPPQTMILHNTEIWAWLMGLDYPFSNSQKKSWSQFVALRQFAKETIVPIGTSPHSKGFWKLQASDSAPSYLIDSSYNKVGFESLVFFSSFVLVLVASIHAFQHYGFAVCLVFSLDSPLALSLSVFLEISDIDLGSTMGVHFVFNIVLHLLPISMLNLQHSQPTSPSSYSTPQSSTWLE